MVSGAAPALLQSTCARAEGLGSEDREEGIYRGSVLEAYHGESTVALSSSLVTGHIVDDPFLCVSRMDADLHVQVRVPNVSTTGLLFRHWGWLLGRQHDVQQRRSP